MVSSIIINTDEHAPRANLVLRTGDQKSRCCDYASQACLQVSYGEIARRLVAKDKQAATAGLPSHVMPKGTRSSAIPADSGATQILSVQLICAAKACIKARAAPAL